VALSPAIHAALGFVHRRGWVLPDWYLLKLWSSDVRDPLQRARIAAYDRDPIRAALEVYRGGRHVERRLPFVTCPTLVIHGGKDRVCPPSNAAYVAARLGTRAVETKLYPSSAHLVAADVDRAAVAADVARFVESLAAELQRVPVEP
jgi:esterase/lipase